MQTHASARKLGFTVLELIVAIVFLAAAGTIFYVYNRDMQITQRDNQRKMAINSIYYNLEDVFYTANKFYPEKLTPDQLPGIDPDILADPNGLTVHEDGSNYRYEPKGCDAGKCKSYTLTADLENEADYVKNSRNQ